ncbi:MAG: hypothetical protein LBQ20_00020 [Rhodanobacter sp.]|jgi:hypothetical protein|nr:hypothetical protein [Rhodanobacter sp.]
MRVTPIVSSSTGAYSRKGQPARIATPATVFLHAWFVTGCIVLALVPWARGSTAFGATLPFWLVVAPLIDLAWIGRARWIRVLQTSRRERRVVHRHSLSGANPCVCVPCGAGTRP